MPHSRSLRHTRLAKINIVCTTEQVLTGSIGPTAHCGVQTITCTAARDYKASPLAQILGSSLRAVDELTGCRGVHSVRWRRRLARAAPSRSWGRGSIGVKAGCHSKHESRPARRPSMHHLPTSRCSLAPEHRSIFHTAAQATVTTSQHQPWHAHGVPRDGLGEQPGGGF